MEATERLPFVRLRINTGYSPLGLAIGEIFTAPSPGIARRMRQATVVLPHPLPVPTTAILFTLPPPQRRPEMLSVKFLKSLPVWLILQPVSVRQGRLRRRENPSGSILSRTDKVIAVIAAIIFPGVAPFRVAVGFNTDLDFHF